MAKPKKGRSRDTIEQFALAFPDTSVDTPWEDDVVVKVGKKIFVFLGGEDSTSMSVKLPESGDHARSLPGATPTGYGLGRHGWVTVPLDSPDAPEELLCDWVEESYRTVAPKKLVARLDAER